MKTRKNRINTQKIIASIMLVVVLFVTIPRPVQADSENGFIEGVLLKPLVQLVASLGDITMGLLNHFMLGTDKIAGSVMLDKSTKNVDEGSLAVTNDVRKSAVKVKVDEKLDGTLLGDWKLPNMLYCPENIFANKIAALDVNFVNPHNYTSVQPDSEEKPEDTANKDKDKNKNENAVDKEEESTSIAESLNGIISAWYRAFRNIAIVGLLSVLIYMGIRILIESTAQGKAKYKERLTDWVVALCLVFVMQYIMSGTLMISEKVTQLFDVSGKTKIIVQLTGDNFEGVTLGQNGTKQFATNLTGYMRFMAQRNELFDCAAYTIIYIALVIFTVKFTFTYLKRVLYMAFFTMISPLVALTYPLDKIADGKAQAFNYWFKEYMMNAVLQPVHLILYTVLVASAADLAVNNPIYALVAIWFLIPAEKFIKKMFRFDRAETTSGFGDFAAGAVTMSALKRLGSSSSHSSKGSGSSKGDDKKIRTKDPIKEDDVKNFSAFKNAQLDEGRHDEEGEDEEKTQGPQPPPRGTTPARQSEGAPDESEEEEEGGGNPTGWSDANGGENDFDNSKEDGENPSEDQEDEENTKTDEDGTDDDFKPSSAKVRSRLRRPAAEMAHRAVSRIENSRIPLLKNAPGLARKVSGKIRNTHIPEPVKNKAKGVRKDSD